MAPRDKDPILALQTIQASKFDDFENPKLQQQEDCLSCRLLGTIQSGSLSYPTSLHPTSSSRLL